MLYVDRNKVGSRFRAVTFCRAEELIACGCLNVSLILEETKNSLRAPRHRYYKDV